MTNLVFSNLFWGTISGIKPKMWENCLEVDITNNSNQIQDYRHIIRSISTLEIKNV